MKRKIWLVPAALLVAMVVWAMPTMLVADVPFGFYAGDSWMPAGEYTVARNPTHHLLRSADARKSVMFTTFNAAEAEGPPALIFTRYPVSNRYFLKQVVNPAAAVVVELPMSRTEREAVSSRLVSERSETVVILARLR